MFTDSATGKAYQKRVENVKTDYGISSDFQFLRRGVVGSYKDELPKDLVQRLDEWSVKALKEANVTHEELFGISQ